jgi:phosphoserine phosphatase RsbU/P
MHGESLAGILSERPQLAQILVESLPGGIGYFDGDGSLLAHNDEFARIVGVVGQHATDYTFRSIAGDTPEDREPSPIERALAGAAVRSEDFELSRPDGTAAWVRVSATPMKTTNGGKTGVLVVALDVGETRGLDSIRQQVLGVVAHDLRNPLSALRMTTAMLIKGTDMPNERRVALAERMIGTIGRMEGMVASLVEFARAEAGVAIRLNREEVDLATVLGRIRHDLEVLFPGRKIDETRKGSLIGQWDGPRLERVLSNLIGNALKHGQDDTPVDLVLDGSDADVLKFSVHNAGPPIAPSLLPVVFEPFTIGPSDQQGRRRSVGLGLFIVRHLVGAHGGSVTVRSTDQEGTTFTVTLPRRVPPPAPSESRSERR